MPDTRPVDSDIRSRRQSRECHRCKRNGTGDPYCWQHCLGPAEESNKGISYVSLNVVEAGDEFLHAKADRIANLDMDKIPDPEGDAQLRYGEMSAGQDEEDMAVTASLSDQVERALVPVLANLMSLTDTQLCIFRHVFHGHDLVRTGQELPVPMSKQAVFKNLLQMCKANKVVEKVIHGMMRKGHGGARKTTTQLDLFAALGIDGG